MSGWVCAAILVLAAGGCRTAMDGSSGPFVIPPCTAPVRLAFAADSGGWVEQVSGIGGLGAQRVVGVPAVAYSPMDTAWSTDEWVFGYRAGGQAVWQMPSERGLAEWGGKCFRERGWPRFETGRLREYPDSRYDAGGNVLVSPPAPGRFPYGRIVTSRQMQPELRKFLCDQRVQTGPDGELIELDTRWLKVGHVDEIVGFVPVAGQAFRLVLPDPEAGMRLLASVRPETAVFAGESGRQVAGRVTAAGARFVEDGGRDFSGGKWKYVRIIAGKGAGLTGLVRAVEKHRLVIERSWNLQDESRGMAMRMAREGRADNMPIWFEIPDETSRYVAVEDSRMWLDGAGEPFPALITAGELAGDASLAAVAGNCAKRIYGPGGIREAVSKALGLREEEAIRLPVLVSGSPEGGEVAALVPNPVNLVCMGNRVVMLKACGPRANPADESSDIFLRAWRTALERLGLVPVFLDGWDALHRLDGGARCGMNVLREM